MEIFVDSSSAISLADAQRAQSQLNWNVPLVSTRRYAIDASLAWRLTRIGRCLLFARPAWADVEGVGAAADPGGRDDRDGRASSGRGVAEAADGQLKCEAGVAFCCLSNV